MVSASIQFVGDPFVDAGVAVLEYRIGKACSEFTPSDLSKQADELEEIYSNRSWTGYLTVHFPNSCWCNANISADKKKQQRDVLLRSFEAAVLPGRICVYCGKPAQHMADRSTIPLLTGAVTMTAGSGGEPGLAVCSACQYATQFYPLATLKVNGKPLFWWTPQHDWMFSLTSDFAKRVVKIIEAAPDQVPSLKWPSTRLLETAEAVFRQSQASEEQLPLVDLVGCHATNFNSDPDYEEIRIRRGVLEFLRGAQQYSAYRVIRDSAWEKIIPKRGKAATEEEKPDRGRRNFLYEELGNQLRSGADRGINVLRRFFTPQAGREPGVFELACLFSRKVLDMTEGQVEAIKTLADQIAESKKAEKYLGRIFKSTKFKDYLRTLTEISDRMKRADEAPIATETILRAFDLTNEDDAWIRDGSLVRELILLRLIEKIPRERLQSLPEPPLEDIEESED